MSIFMSNTKKEATKIETSSRAMVRIAIPSFKIGWRTTKPSKKSSGPTIEEFQSLFHDDFGRSIKGKIKLTAEERNDQMKMNELRIALSTPTGH